MRQRAARVDVAKLTEGPAAPSDPDAVTLMLTGADPNSFEVVTRIFPEGGALLWVGRKGAPLGPVELDPEDATEFTGFVDALVEGDVKLVVMRFRGRQRLIKVIWPDGEWLADVSPATAIAALLGCGNTILGAAYGQSV